MTFTCQAMVMREVGGPEVLEPREVELAWPGGPDDVLVKLEAASINPADTFFRQLGLYVGDGRGVVLGHDGAGTVEAVGDGVTGVKPGDRVCFCNGGIGGDPGTYASHAVVPEWLLAPVPDNVEITEAAALPLVFITGWEALAERAAVEQGEHVLIHAGAGGTGHMAVQIARELGGIVAATVSSPEKAAVARELGAEATINYRETDFVEAAKDWSGGGVDAALDNVSPEVFQATLRAMAPYGRLVTLIGTPGDLEDETAYNANLTIHNVMMLTPMWLGLDDRRRAQGHIVRVGVEWLAEGRIRPKVTETWPLEKVAEAHARMEQGGVTGKIVLTIG